MIGCAGPGEVLLYVLATSFKVSRARRRLCTYPSRLEQLLWDYYELNIKNSRPLIHAGGIGSCIWRERERARERERDKSFR